VRHIRAAIASAPAGITFSAFQDLALYAPGMGYYSGPLDKFGPAGDFTTAPELTPLFGATIARAIAPVLRSGGGAILELGAGSGRLAHDLLSALAVRDARPSEYHILELSGDLAARQRATLAEWQARGVPCVWQDALPERWHGVVVANEVLDAVPTAVCTRRGGAFTERYVVESAAGHLAFHDHPVGDGALLERMRRVFPDLGAPYTSEINLRAEALVAALAERLVDGILLLIDYGFSEREFYHPDRSDGTVMCHYRHHAHPDPLWWPGLQDITSHVDWTAMARAAGTGGAEVLLYTTQAQFLLAHGLLDALADGPQDGIAYLRSSGHLQRLVNPAEMGELFKVLVLGKGRAAREWRTAARPLAL
jgi:SAM-dependent MidA family methyltransferase